MCGIIGYIGNSEKKQILLDGLSELEYRGYDSAGIAVLCGENGGDLSVFKSAGKLKNLTAKCADFQSSGFGVAIGHTRWATHGKVSDTNAHPQSAEFSAVVHNGIIENYSEIRADLEQKGHKFSSQTDTEIIVHLFEENLNGADCALSAFKATIARLQGSYALLLITKGEKDKIFYAKNGSPLIIGRAKSQDSSLRTSEASVAIQKNSIDCHDSAIAESRNDNVGDIYFASSSSPLLGIVSEVCYLEDGEYGFMDRTNFSTLPRIQKLVGTKLSAQKEGYRYFMEKEIYEQSAVLKDTLAGRIANDKIALEIDDDFLEGVESITLCACGTSHNAALVAKYIFEREAKIKTSVAIASEFRYAEPVMNPNELFIVISQSGETADTLEALKLAKRANLKTLAICNVEDSSIVREAQCSLLTRAGIEKGVASTKAFATQVMLLWILGVYLGKKRGAISSDKLKAHIKNMKDATNAAKIDEAMHDRLKKLSKRYLHGHGFFFIGRDIFYPLALEGALKLKELSYLHAEGYPSGEMKHGPIALADSELFTISLMPKHLLFDKIKNNTAELSTRDATICVISQEDCALADDMVKIKKFDSYMEEFFAMMVILQVLALEVAIRLGNDVDMPRNLAKSVTVE
ncbi:glutamine--fructose-6-phosphate transaminase (isomerizing) [Helicobacter sp. 23-1045]